MYNVDNDDYHMKMLVPTLYMIYLIISEQSICIVN